MRDDATVLIYPDPAPQDIATAWGAAVEDANLRIADVALIWRPGRPRPTGQEAGSWRPGDDIELEFHDDLAFVPAGESQEVV